MKLKVLLVDDYPIFRSGLKLLLEERSDIEVIGEAGNSDELFKILSEKKPDVIVLDFLLLNKTIVPICKEISKISPDTPFIIISVRNIENTLIECITNGAKGFLWKDSSKDELISAIHKVASGGKYFVIPESLMLEKIIKQFSIGVVGENSTGILTKRETEVVKHIASGKTYKQVAEAMEISPRTVESHKNNIIQKLNLNSITDLVKYAIKNQLIKL